LLRLRRRMPAGSFRSLLADGAIARAGLSIGTTHLFRSRTIDERWDVRCRGTCGPYTVDVQLPSWGAGAAITAIRRDGTRLTVTPAAAIALADVGTLVLGDGYTATPIVRPPGAVLLAIPTSPQPTDTHPGPTLAIRLVASAPVTRTRLAVRLQPLAP
jgi:hypothetical protein